MPPKIKYFSRCANWDISSSMVITRARICWMLLRKCSSSSDGVIVSISDWFRGGVLPRLQGIIMHWKLPKITSQFTLSPVKSIHNPKVVLRVLLTHSVNRPSHTGQLNVLVVLRVQRVCLWRNFGVIGGGREVVLRQDDGPRWRRHPHRVPVRRFHNGVL